MKTTNKLDVTLYNEDGSVFARIDGVEFVLEGAERAYNLDTIVTEPAQHRQPVPVAMSATIPGWSFAAFYTRDLTWQWGERVLNQGDQVVISSGAVMLYPPKDAVA